MMYSIYLCLWGKKSFTPTKKREVEQVLGMLKGGGGGGISVGLVFLRKLVILAIDLLKGGAKSCKGGEVARIFNSFLGGGGGAPSP